MQQLRQIVHHLALITAYLLGSNARLAVVSLLVHHHRSHLVLQLLRRVVEELRDLADLPVLQGLEVFEFAVRGHHLLLEGHGVEVVVEAVGDEGLQGDHAVLFGHGHEIDLVLELQIALALVEDAAVLGPDVVVGEVQHVLLLEGPVVAGLLVAHLGGDHF